MMTSFPAFGILLRSRSQRRALEKLLEDNSGLPGPRANIELGFSFAHACAAVHFEDWQWDFLVELANLSAAEAPVNTPREYLTFCGLLALGELYGQGLPRPRRRAALAAMKRAASDERWRTREGCAMALQLVGEADAPALRRIVEDWLPDSSLLERRAIAAALAHPPILKDPELALFALDVAARLLSGVTRLGREERKSEGFRVLKTGLGYAVSVLAAASPVEGFALLRKSAAVDDADISWIVRENISKKRLSGAFPEETRQVSLIVERTIVK